MIYQGIEYQVWASLGRDEWVLLTFPTSRTVKPPYLSSLEREQRWLEQRAARLITG
jgi:hypothetical protein